MYNMRKFLVAVVAAMAMTFGFSGISNAEMIKKVDYFSLLMDRSGSMFMCSDCVKGVNKMFIAKTAVGNVFDSVPDELGFDSALKLSCDTKTVFAGKYANETVDKFLKDSVPDDGTVFGKMTPLAKAIAEENVSEPKETRNAVILVTDGEYNLGRNPVETVKELYSSHPNSTVHVISLADTPKGERTIKEIAALKEGSVVASACELAKSGDKAREFALKVFFGTENALEIFFEVNKAVIRPSEKEKLDAVKGKTARVEGWASIDGPKAFNQALSEKRAKAVAEYLGTNDFEGKGISTKYKKRKMNRRADVVVTE